MFYKLLAEFHVLASLDKPNDKYHMPSSIAGLNTRQLGQPSCFCSDRQSAWATNICRKFRAIWALV